MIVKRSLSGKPSTYFELAGDKENSDQSIPKFKATHGPSPSYIIIKGLHASLKAIMKEGPDKVYKRHAVAGKAIREAVRAMGFQVLAGEDNAAPCCTVILLPGEVCEVRAICQKMQEEHGIAIGLGSSKKEILGYVGIRVGHMGFVADQRFVLPLIAALENVLFEAGYEVNMGMGVEAARTVFFDNKFN